MAASDPRGEYQLRYGERCTEAERLDQHSRRLGDARLAVFLLGLAALWPTLVSRSLGPGWLMALVLLFAVLVALRSGVMRKLDRARQGVAFYERGLERLAGERRRPLEAGLRFLPEEHPYAADLDLFGDGSLYALLCTARSLPGRERLASWLLNRAEPEEVLARQQAVKELRGRLDLHEELAVLAADLSPELDEARLGAWGARPIRLRGRWVPLVAGALGVVNLVAVTSWLFGPLEGKMLLAILAASVALVAAVRGRAVEALAGLALPAGEIRFLAAMLARLESETFTSERLAAVRVEDRGARPSARLAELARLIEWNDSRSNQLFIPLASLALAGTQLAFAVERWRARNGSEVGEWLRAIGDVEALGALSTFSYENPDYPFPVLAEGAPRFEARALDHPLLPEATRVANDVALGGDDAAPRLLLISGSNMSGKSTLLRTVGVAAVLAFAGAPVPARELLLTPLAVGASLQVHDSLLEGVSRFYAELQQISRVRELAGRVPTLFLLDEILHGTNSHDRRLGAGGVIRALLEAGAIGLVTTHDLALAEVADELGPLAANVHFEDHLEEGRMAFDYSLRPGVVERGNALALMRSLNLPVEEE